MEIWIKQLQHPLVVVGFGLFIFALIIKPLFLGSKKVSGAGMERLLHKGMILLFILAAMAVAGGIALNWKATPAADAKPAGKSSDAEGMRSYEQRLRAVEQNLLALQASGGAADEQTQRALEQKLKAVQEKLADVRKSWEDELKLRKEAEAGLAKLKGQLPDEQIRQAQDSLAKGDKDKAEQAVDAVADNAGKAVALAAYQSGKLAEDRLDYAKAMRQYKKAVALEEDNADYLLAAGRMAWKTAAYQEAENWFSRLLKIRETGKDDAKLGAALNNLALMYDEQGRYADAEPLYKQSLEIGEKSLGKDHPDVAHSLNNLAALYYAQSRYVDAEPLYKRSLEIRENKLGKDHPNVATTLNNLANLYRQQGRYADAEPLYQRAIAIMKKKFPDGHPNIDVMQENYDILKEKMVNP